MIEQLKKRKTFKCRLGIQGCKAVTLISILICLSLMLSSCTGSAGPAGNQLIQEAKDSIQSADVAMGDWQGSWKLDDGTDSGPLVAQVIALGKGEYRANCLEEFDKRITPLAVLNGRRYGTEVQFVGKALRDGAEYEVRGVIEAGKFTGTFQDSGNQGSFALERTVRISPTLGAKPPKGAIVLFDGTNFNEWKHPNKKKGEDLVKWELWELNETVAMRVKRGAGSIITRRQFADVKLHIEFRTPFQPEKRGQGRGNSGVYLQGRYEVQVLDSYGLEGKSNECGGIYGVKEPLVNMCAPPTQWQTYDITFHAPRLDSEGKQLSKATLTVLHNGVLIHDKTEAGGATTASLGGDAAKPEGIYLQNHGNPVLYRNIWVVEL